MPRLKTILSTQAALIAALMAAPPAYAQTVHSFDLPAQSLNDSLQAVGQRTGTNIAYTPEAVRGKRAPALRGSYTTAEALDGLLRGSGLTVSTTSGGSYLVVAQNSAATGGPEDELEEQAGAESSDTPIILVTGTSIRGNIPDSAALDVYTRDDFQDLGVVTADEFLRTVPQNLNSTGSVGANSIGRATNARNINAPDLRGLGAGATLSLLNGRRLPLANLGRGSDTSLIPFGAVERVEILTDGASSIYGSDAVGGVVNFILRDRYEGAITSAAYTVRGDGGYSAAQINQTGGVDWDTGGVLASLSARTADPFRGEEVDFVIPPTTTLSPADDRVSIFFSASQDIGNTAEISVDLLYANRDTTSTTDEGATIFVNETDTEQLFANVGLTARLTDALNLDVVATYATLDDELAIQQIVDGVEAPVSESPQTYDSFEFTAKIDGKLLALASEDVLFALGGGYRREALKFNIFDLERKTYYAFGELAVPIIGEGRNIPLVQRLELNLSARYTSPSDFGDSFDPRIGLSWRLNDSLAVRGTWSSSFRAPELLQIASSPFALEILPVDSLVGSFPDPFSNDRSTVYLALSAATNPDLTPETSQAFTLGLDFTPPRIEGLRASVTYYNIDYTDRIAFPASVFEIAGNPALFADFISEPSLAVIQDLASDAFGVFDFTDFSFDPAPDANALADRVTRLILTGPTNIASQKTSGMDLAVDYGWAIDEFRLNVGGKLAYMFVNKEQLTPDFPVIQRLDTISYPVDLRGRVYVGVARSGWSGRLTLNYVDDYVNTAVDPDEPIGDWITLDLGTSYEFGAGHGWLNGLRVGLSVQNLLNTDPPFVASTPVGGTGSVADINYDAANHSPFGRLFTFTLTKEW